VDGVNWLCPSPPTVPQPLHTVAPLFGQMGPIQPCHPSLLARWLGTHLALCPTGLDTSSSPTPVVTNGTCNYSPQRPQAAHIGSSPRGLEVPSWPLWRDRYRTPSAESPLLPHPHTSRSGSPNICGTGTWCPPSPAHFLWSLYSFNHGSSAIFPHFPRPRDPRSRPPPAPRAPLVHERKEKAKKVPPFLFPSSPHCHQSRVGDVSNSMSDIYPGGNDSLVHNMRKSLCVLSDSALAFVLRGRV